MEIFYCIGRTLIYLNSVGGGDVIQAITLNLLNGVKQSESSKTGTPFSYSSSMSVLESKFTFIDSYSTLFAK